MKKLCGILLDYTLMLFIWIGGFLIFLRAFNATPLLPGIDGPYYAVQVNWILKYGGLKYLDPPLTFYIMAFFANVLGDVFIAVKAVASLFTAATVVPLYLFYRDFLGERGGGISASLVFILNFYTFRLLGDFIKNSIGLLWLASYIYFLYKFLREKTRGSLAGLLFFLALTALTHVLDLGTAMLLTFILTALVFIFKIDKVIVVPFMICIIFLLGLFIAPAVVGHDIFKFVAFIEETLGESDASMQMPFDEFIKRGIISLTAVSLLFLTGIRNTLAREDKRNRVFLLALAFSSLLLNLPFYPMQWLFRFQLMSSIFIAYATGFCTSHLKTFYSKLVLLTLFTSLLLATNHYIFTGFRPSIPLEEYNELVNVVQKYSGKSFVVPDTRLRYWVETLTEKVYKKPPAVQQNKILFIFDRRHLPKIPLFKPLYEGKYIIVMKAWKPPKIHKP
ncbi:MAG: hypothetical protein DRJ47_09030 [Thermoprotei archaeon]|nr:MAG: hypothetical protein DRJ47_09030 [Thermoprotei archaeon]